jgi:hypothetical protein
LLPSQGVLKFKLCVADQKHVATNEDGGVALATDGGLSIHYPGGLLGMVRPDGQGWHFSLLRDDDLFTMCWVRSKSEAQRIVQKLAPMYGTGSSEL